MSDDATLPQNIKDLYDVGCKLKARILKFLESWPLDDKNDAIDWDKTNDTHKGTANELIDDTRRWFNTLKIEVMPYIVYEPEYLYYTLRKVEAAIKKHSYKRPYPESGPKTITVVDRKILFQEFWDLVVLRLMWIMKRILKGLKEKQRREWIQLYLC